MARGTVGLGGAINSDARSGERWCRDGKRRRPPDEKICRICGKPWTPLNQRAAGKRDICYSPECERAREAERHERHKERQREWYKSRPPVKKTCRICGKLWVRKDSCLKRRDICYRVKCEKTRDERRRERRLEKRRERYRKKKAERERKAKHR